ncbi:MAG: galactokinase [Gemmatimonadaceae bacterium]
MPSRAAVVTQIPNAESVSALFRSRFGLEPHTVASAPGRVNLIGEHTDYNGGQVLPIAIARRTWVAVRLREGTLQPTLRAVSATEQEAGEVPLKNITKSGRWWDYVLGVAEPLMHQARGDGAEQLSLDVAVSSDVPSGAGLGSSAALEVASALAISALFGEELNARDAAMAAWRAETEFVGVACGIMDQFASALAREGNALHIDCETAGTGHAPFSDSVLIIDTAVRRSLRSSLFSERQLECAQALALLRKHWPALTSLAAAEPEQVVAAALPHPLDRRALHVSRETRRVRDAASLLRTGQPLTHELLVGSHDSLRDLYECSCPELDWLVQRAINFPGVRGARLTGAGWGGCVIVVGDSALLESASSEVAREYRFRFDLTPRLWSSRAAPGARIERRT